jgi:hypothetical protein
VLVEAKGAARPIACEKKLASPAQAALCSASFHHSSAGAPRQGINRIVHHLAHLLLDGQVVNEERNTSVERE